ncbi:hypothetical protein CISG_00588 [Coccidioides immitis RMSCC 3703]|uniref:Uncharacterized protein n=2 Tax=Coccidioides immitis TaxID=5501 RepID=A0A0J8QTT8_COCIT|nr:hypothetical protein CIRG_03377 [Coccidioides immitis RMSCC 2394]KMU74658.1 hypothetical protein CISG_00588 [Coccidioides immitis RMSCC 3703]
MFVTIPRSQNYTVPARFWGTKANSLPPAWKSTADFRASMPWGLVILDFYSVPCLNFSHHQEAVEKRLARSKILQYTSSNCDGKCGTGDKHFIPDTKRVDVKGNSCSSQEHLAWTGYWSRLAAQVDCLFKSTQLDIYLPKLGECSLGVHMYTSEKALFRLM